MELEKGKAELALRREEAEQAFADARAELDEAARQIAQGEAQLEQCRNLYAAGAALTLGINAGLGRQYGSPNELIADLSSGTDAMLAAAADSALASYSLTAETFCAAWTQAEEQLGAPLREETIAALAAGLDDARGKYEEGAAQLEGEKTNAEAAFAEAEAEIAASEARITAGESEYAEG